jgi:hypothetical protein
VNEEELKIKYVLPWLKQSGVVLQDLPFEQTFSVKIGRQQITVGDDDGAKRDEITVIGTFLM